MIAATTLHALQTGQNLTFSSAFQLCDDLLSGTIADEQVARTLTLLAKKGETPTEVHAFVRCLLSHAEKVPFDRPTVDTCGTGGSGLVRFNVSTAVAFILAASGCVVAKHGNRGSREPNGSVDLLAALDVPVDLGPRAVAECLERTGLGFIYARRFHPAMKRVAAARALAGGRTIFNFAGPLSNPTYVQTQIVGVPSPQNATLIAHCLGLLGRRTGIAVSGYSGIDDVDLAGAATLAHAGPPVTLSSLDPTQLGLPIVPFSELPGGTAPTNAALFLSLVRGSGPQSLHQLVCLSAAVVLVAAERAIDYAQGYAHASELLISGQVYDKFVDYRQVAYEVATLDTA